MLEDVTGEGTGAAVLGAVVGEGDEPIARGGEGAGGWRIAAAQSFLQARYGPAAVAERWAEIIEKAASA